MQNTTWLSDTLDGLSRISVDRCFKCRPGDEQQGGIHVCQQYLCVCVSLIQHDGWCMWVLTKGGARVSGADNSFAYQPTPRTLAAAASLRPDVAEYVWTCQD